MHKDLLLEMVKQHQFTSHFCFDRVTEETATLRLNDRTASIGFIYRHIAETINLFAQMLGAPTDVKNTTIGQIDTGQHYDVTRSRDLIDRGYRVLQDLVENSTEDDWLKPVETPFFGSVSRIRLLAHTLYHTSNHAGQISLTLARGTPASAADAEKVRAVRITHERTEAAAQGTTAGTTTAVSGGEKPNQRTDAKSQE